jgi:hypothetical protein
VHIGFLDRVLRLLLIPKYRACDPGEPLIGIGALDLRKSSWHNGLSQGWGETRCTQRWFPKAAPVCLVILSGIPLYPNPDISHRLGACLPISSQNASPARA